MTGIRAESVMGAVGRTVKTEAGISIVVTNPFIVIGTNSPGGGAPAAV